jgi:chromosome segregation ATPase
MALRDVRAEGSRLDEQEKDLKTQQQSLTQGIKRLRSDLKGLMPRLKEKGLEIPNPDFPLAELEDEPASAD